MSRVKGRMGRYRKIAFSIVALTVFAIPAYAQETPVGAWKTIDDASGKPRAIIRITEANGTLSGKIEKLISEPGEEQNPRCIPCTDARKDQPIVGMTILTGLKREGIATVWSGGEILDPDTAKVYKCKATLTGGGRKLEMRGYIGVPILGRTQTWIREP